MCPTFFYYFFCSLVCSWLSVFFFPILNTQGKFVVFNTYENMLNATETKRIFGVYCNSSLQPTISFSMKRFGFRKSIEFELELEIVYAVCCMYPCATSVCASNASCHLFTSTDIFGFALAFKVSGFYAFVIFLCLFPLFGNVWFLVFACFFLSFIFPFSIQFTGLYMLSRCKYVVYK